MNDRWIILVAALVCSAAALLLVTSLTEDTTEPSPPAVRQPNDVADRTASPAVVIARPRPGGNSGASEVRDSQPAEAFDTRSDLFAMFERALAENNRTLSAQASRVALECDGMLAWYDDQYGVIAGGGVPSVRTGALTQARRDAIGEIIRRCDGFGRLSKAQRQQAIAALTAKARALGSAEAKFAVEGVASMTGNDVVAMIQEASGSNFEALLIPLSNIAEQWAIEEHGLSRDRASAVGGLGAMLVLCDLSATCRSDSLRSLVACAVTGRCLMNLTDGWDVGLSEQEKSIVLAYQVRMLSAIRAKQWSALGLP